MHYTPTHAVQREPMKSTRKGNCSRLVSDGVVHRSRTITRTISTRQRRKLIEVKFQAKAADENLPVKMLMPASVGPYALAVFNTSAVLQYLVFRGSPTTLHTTIVRDKPRFANQRNQGCDGQIPSRNTVSPQLGSATHSDCIPDVLLQVLELWPVMCDCPRTVRVSENLSHAI